MSAKVADEIFSVSLLTRHIRRLLEDGLPPLWIEGEISNYTLHRSGHRYFTLKDENAQIPCVMWRTRHQLPFSMEGGQHVKLFGRVAVWEPGGRYQFDVHSVMLAGMGSLQEAFEKLKQKLAVEGLFDQDRKRPLPRFPNSIGIVTSPTGAAIRDIAWGFVSRYPPAKLYLIPVSVQGDTAGQEIAQAIDDFNRLNLVDVIISGRGGGSLEDLWAFNEEVVVRAIVRSEIPVVSSVGHEVDVTLSDLAADLRAPTPTAAASLTVPDRLDLLATLAHRKENIFSSIQRSVLLRAERLKNLERGYSFRRVFDRVADYRQRLDATSRRMEESVAGIIKHRSTKLNGIRDQIEALSPMGVLKRGYCIAQNVQGQVVTGTNMVKVGDDVDLRFSRGVARSRIKEIINSE